MQPLRYNSYSAYFKHNYGTRLQKLSVDAGFSCPNRNPHDRAKGGCTFCNNQAFNPSYCSPQKSITQQLDEGIEFHQHRYRNAEGYLAYFQPYSNTFAPVDKLKDIYSEALAHPKVKGLIIGTRPDCVDDAKLDLIASLAGVPHRFVAIEYGIESCYDATLAAIRRGHDFQATRHAINLTAERGIHCGVHLVLGLPGESHDMILAEADIINSLPINSLKLHQLQVIKGTPMADGNAQAGNSFRLDEYISLVCDFVERLRPDILIERFAGEVPPRFQAFPERSWRRPDGRLLRNEQIPPMVNNELVRRGTCQGYHYQS